VNGFVKIITANSASRAFRYWKPATASTTLYPNSLRGLRFTEEDAMLLKLKELEYTEKICKRIGSKSVGNGNNLT